MRAPHSLVSPSRSSGRFRAASAEPAWSRILLAIVVTALVGCAAGADGRPSGGPAATTVAADGAASPEAPPRDPVVLLVIGDTPNASEELLIDRLRGTAAALTVVDDGDLAAADLERPDLVVLSKTVQSGTVGDVLRDVCAGVLLWEDNEQAADGLALIDARELPDTVWHRSGTTVHVAAGVDPELRAGLRGTVELLTRQDEITYAPADDAGSTLVRDAIRIAEFDEEGDGRWALYAVEAGSRLSDGIAAAGRRYFFGLYDDTFRLLTPDGLALFDAAVTWTAGLSTRGGCT